MTYELTNEDLLKEYVVAYGQPDESFLELIDMSTPVDERRAKACYELADLMAWVLKNNPIKYDQMTWGDIAADVLGKRMAAHEDCNTAHCLAGWAAGALMGLHPIVTGGAGYPKFFWGVVSTEPLQTAGGPHCVSIEWVGFWLGLPEQDASDLFEEDWWAQDIPHALRMIGDGEDPEGVKDNPCEFDACHHDMH